MFKFFRKKKKDEPQFEDINKFYVVGREIGKGAFSVVKVAKNRQTGQLVAIKTISKKWLVQKDVDMLEREIDIMKKLEHPNIVELLGVSESADEIHIIMELIEGGELFDHIVERGFYSEREASIIVRQLLEAVAFMHKHGIAHRDLKPQNLLCTKDGLTIKIADFGLSRIIDEGSLMKTACGTPDYVAPEILQCQPYSSGVDIWSVGIITYIILSGFTPFFAETHTELFDKIIRYSFDFPDPEWTDISAEAKDFISRLLQKKPDSRMTAEQALEHPWLSGKAPMDKLKRMDSFQALLLDYNAKRKLQKNEDSGSDELLKEGLKD